MNEVYQIECYSCKKPITLEARRESDGDCPNCGCELCLEGYFLSASIERDALQAKIKQLEAELEQELQENASLRGGSMDDYERGAE